ncbi:hypothetical protein BD779DRAFT_1671322 [Infundibulicybe gibba]|nr:hypothetical protein BD779DRAFT_1671322 [Infundibulicybe gibba]
MHDASAWEENATLRSQLDTVEWDNMGLERELGEPKGLVRDLEDKKLRGIGHARGFGTGQLGFGGSNDNLQDTPSTRTNLPLHFISREVHLPLVLDSLDFHPPHPHLQPASSTPNTKRHRRMSTTSSVSLFPIPPMLLHDDAKGLAASTPTKLQQVYQPNQQQPPSTQIYQIPAKAAKNLRIVTCESSPVLQVGDSVS